MMSFPKEITIGAKYDPAMKVTDPTEAKAYFEACVEHSMQWGNNRQEAERIEKANLGYYAGYYDNETRRRVERLFQCSHPVFGSIAETGSPTPKEAFQAGVAMATNQRGKPNDPQTP